MSLIFAEHIPTTFETINGIVGNAISVFFYISPITLFISLIKGKTTTDKIPYLMFVINVINNVLWVVYGLQLKNVQLWAGNAIGGIASTIYICIYCVYILDKHVLKSMHVYFLYI